MSDVRSAFAHEHHPWKAERAKVGHGASSDHVGFNGRLAARITKSVGSMWAAYAFACLALVSLPSAIRSGDPVVMVSWVSQTFLQLVLLAVIMVGQDVLSQAADKRAELTYRDVEAILHELDQTRLHLEHQDRILDALQERKGKRQ